MLEPFTKGYCGQPSLSNLFLSFCPCNRSRLALTYIGLAIFPEIAESNTDYL